MGSVLGIVIINAYDNIHVKYLLKSIFSQNYDEYTIYIVNVGTNLEYFIEKHYKEYANRINIFNLRKDFGPSNQRNIGTYLALRDGNEYVLYLDNDTYMHDRKLLSKLVEAMEHSDDEIVGMSPLILNIDKTLQWGGAYMINGLIYEILSEQEMPSLEKYCTFFIHGAAFIVRAKILKYLANKIGLFRIFNPKAFIGFDDYEFCLKVYSTIPESKFIIDKNIEIIHRGSSITPRISPWRLYHAIKNFYYISSYFQRGYKNAVLYKMISQYFLLSMLRSRYDLKLFKPLLNGISYIIKSSYMETYPDVVIPRKILLKKIVGCRSTTNILFSDFSSLDKLCKNKHALKIIKGIIRKWWKDEELLVQRF